MSYTPTNWIDGETPVNAENLNKLEQGVADIHMAKENGELNGKDGDSGKSAYAYAQDGGYTGTEEEFAQKLASSSGYPNPCVMDYAAKGDGSADDTAAFQAALAENRVVFVPGGTYKLSGELNIGNNCTLELSQDTVLDFTQTTGNCITLGLSSSIKGNHGTIVVPYAFSGNVINADTASTKLEEIYTLHPWAKWDPMWKYGRYITDLNITKPDSRGFHYSVNGDTCGTAVSVMADGTDDTHYMWGLRYSGLRIAGAFSYGIHARCDNEAWLHEMRIDDTFMTGCEIGVLLENCNNAYISAIVQPSVAVTMDEKNIPYAKHGIKLVNSKNCDLSGSRVWDWNAAGTLWTEDGEYQMIALVGNCRGAIINAFQYYETSTDIRDQIYTDTPSNLEQMNILQEPITRWFKPKDNEPYFFNGNGEKRLALKEEIDEFFVTDRIAQFTNVLESGIDKDGNIYGTASGYYDSKFENLTSGSAGAYHIHTGFIACKKGDSFYTDGIGLREDGCVRVAFFDSDFNFIVNVNGGNMMAGNYQVSYEALEAGFKLTINSHNDANINKIAYARFNFNILDIGERPVMSINEEIKFTQAGFLADGIKVKGENVVDGGVGTSDAVQYIPQTLTEEQQMQARANMGLYHTEAVEILPETTVEIDPEQGMGLIPADFIVEAGKEYTVKYNGVEYVTNCLEPTPGLIFLGNAGAADQTFPNTGEPFMMAYSRMGEDDSGNPIMAWAIVPVDGSASVILSIAEVKHHLIPIQYVPCMLPYYIDVKFEDENYSTSETVSNLTAIHNSGREVKVRVTELGSNGAVGIGYLSLFATIDLDGKKTFQFTSSAPGSLDNRCVVFHPQDNDTYIVDENYI